MSTKSAPLQAGVKYRVVTLLFTAAAAPRPVSNISNSCLGRHANRAKKLRSWPSLLAVPAAWASALCDKAKHPADHGSLPGLSHHFGTTENTHSAHEVIPQRLKEIKVKNGKWIRGIDGRKLAASSGRLRTMGKHVRECLAATCQI